MTRAANLAEAAGSGFAFRNRIINGDMRIDQRNAGASVGWGGGDGLYALDRLRLQRAGAATLSVQQVADAPPGFSKSVKFTVTGAAAPSSGDYYTLGQIIEPANYIDFAYGTANAKTVTVSFWAKSSVSGSYTASIYDWLVGGYTYATSFTINAANTWEYKTIVVPGVTTGSWANGLYFRIDLGSGSSYTTSSPNTWNTTGSFRVSGAVNFTANASATFNMTGLQIEPGSVATPFEFRMNELQLCQRYYEQFGQAGSGSATGATSGELDFKFSVDKRVTPTITLIGTGNPQIGESGVGMRQVTSLNGYIGSPSGAYVAVICSGANMVIFHPLVGICSNFVSGFLAASAEL